MDDKYIEAAWDEFAKVCIPVDASEIQVKDLRNAFLRRGRNALVDHHDGIDARYRADRPRHAHDGGYTARTGRVRRRLGQAGVRRNAALTQL